MSDRIYLDYAATTPLLPELKTAWQTLLSEQLGNPSSLHREGQHARAQLDRARQRAAEWLGVLPSEILFTSGATEANNILLVGLIEALASSLKNPHIILSSLEHPSLLRTAEMLEKTGQISLTLVTSDKDGMVSLTDIRSAIRPETILMSVIHTSNEFGTLQPIRGLVEVKDEVKLERWKAGNGTPLFVHTDAVQAAQYMDLHLLGVDALTVSAHKAGGPPGVGIFMHRTALPLRPLIYGGAQETGLRAGTEATQNMIVSGSLWEKLALPDERRSRFDTVQTVRNAFEQQLLRLKPEVVIIGQTAARAPHISTIILPNVEAQVFQIQADLAGLACSVGSACSSGASLPSSAQLALPISESDQRRIVRFSFADTVTIEEAHEAAKRVAAILRGQN